MIDFSELLSQHIVQKNIKTYALAQYCGLDRANMYKIINGKRRAPSINIVKKICQFMHLSPVEEKELEESYYVSLVGHTNYYRRKNVLHFFSEFTLSNRLLSSVSCQFEFSLPTLKNATLNGKDEIHRALLHITALELTRKKGISAFSYSRILSS